MTQNDQIVQYVKKHGSITPLEALRHCGCLRLASRIVDLHAAGYETRRLMVTDTQSGKSYAKYYITRYPEFARESLSIGTCPECGATTYDTHCVAGCEQRGI